MATIKLGAFISDIAGSVGSTTFRRTSRGTIAYNKQSRQTKSSQALASKRLAIGQIFAQWNQLPKETKNEWASLATLYPKTDKFGKDVFLSGRQFFTKLNTQLTPVNGSVDLTNFNDVRPSAIVTDLEFTLSNDEILLEIVNVTDTVQAHIAFYRLRSGGSVKPHAHFKATALHTITTNSSIDVITAFKAQFPFAKVGDSFGCNIYFINPSGFVSPVKTFSLVAV